MANSIRLTRLARATATVPPSESRATAKLDFHSEEMGFQAGSTTTARSALAPCSIQRQINPNSSDVRLRALDLLPAGGITKSST